MADRKRGVRQMTVDGDVWSVDASSVKYSTDDKEIETVNTTGGRLSSESPVSPYIEAKVFKTPDQAWADLNGPKSEIVLDLADGTVVLRDAEKVGVSEPEAKDQSATIRFEGLQCREVK